MSGFLINAELLALIRRTVRQVLGEYRNAEGHRGRYQQNQRRLQGVLDFDLDSADAWEDAPSTATFSVYAKNSSGDMADTGRNVVVTNRALFLTYTAGTYCKIEWIKASGKSTPQIARGEACRRGTVVNAKAARERSR